MTRSKFYIRAGVIVGFELTGHAGAGAQGEDIVCAAVSSAAYLTVNTLTDVYGCPAAVKEGEAFLSLRWNPDRLDGERAARCAGLLEGLRVHLEQLAVEYPDHIRVTIIGGVIHAENKHPAVRPQKGRRLHKKRP